MFSNGADLEDQTDEMGGIQHFNVQDVECPADFTEDLQSIKTTEINSVKPKHQILNTTDDTETEKTDTDNKHYFPTNIDDYSCRENSEEDMCEPSTSGLNCSPVQPTNQVSNSLDNSETETDDTTKDKDYICSDSDDSSSTEHDEDTCEPSTRDVNCLPHAACNSKESNMDDKKNTENQTAYSKTETPLKKVRNKNFCVYCNSEVLDFSRHIFRNHSTEIEVKKIVAMPKGIDKNRCITSLRKKGNFVNASAGKIKPVKRFLVSSLSKAATCPFCLGAYAKRRLWRHKKMCSNRTTDIATSD